MRYTCKSYEALCSLKKFEINGIEASYTDFGYKEDITPNVASNYGCGNIKFISKPATQKVLYKYNINVDEYNKVCEKLDEQLSFGMCNWCV